MSEQDVLADELVDLVEVFLRLRRDVVNFVEGSREALEGVYPDHRDSAENLLHYLALRGSDLRPLQVRLATVGLSSLGRAESHVLPAVDAVLAVLHRALNRPWDPSYYTRPRSISMPGSACWMRIPERCSALFPPNVAWPLW